MNKQAITSKGKLLLKRQEISRQDLNGVFGGADSDSSEEIAKSVSKFISNSFGVVSLGDESKELAKNMYRSVPDWYDKRDTNTKPVPVPPNSSKADGSIDTRRTASGLNAEIASRYVP